MCDWRWPLAIHVGVGYGQFFWSPTLSSHFLISPSDTICTIMSSVLPNNWEDYLQLDVGKINRRQVAAALMKGIPGFASSDARWIWGIMFISAQEALEAFGEWIDQSDTCIDDNIYLLHLACFFLTRSYMYSGSTVCVYSL